MTDSIHILCSLMLLILMFSCVSSETGTPGHPEVSSETKVDEKNIVSMKKTGGLEKIAVDSEEAVKTYSLIKEELAVSHPEIELKQIKKAYSQVVAGHNIILICEYKEGEEEEHKLLYTKVYYDLETNWNLITLTFEYSDEEEPGTKEE